MKMTIKMTFNRPEFFVIKSETDPYDYKWKIEKIYIAVKVGTLNIDNYNRLLKTWTSGETLKYFKSTC